MGKVRYRDLSLNELKKKLYRQWCRHNESKESYREIRNILEKLTLLKFQRNRCDDCGILISKKLPYISILIHEKTYSWENLFKVSNYESLCSLCHRYKHSKAYDGRKLIEIKYPYSISKIPIDKEELKQLYINLKFSIMKVANTYGVNPIEILHSLNE